MQQDTPSPSSTVSLWRRTAAEVFIQLTKLLHFLGWDSFDKTGNAQINTQKWIYAAEPAGEYVQVLMLVLSKLLPVRHKTSL